MGNKFEQYHARKAEQEKINEEQLKYLEKQIDKRYKIIYQKLIENCTLEKENYQDQHFEHIDLLKSKNNQNLFFARKEICFDTELEAVRSQIGFQNRSQELLHPNLIQLHQQEITEVSKFEEEDLWFFIDSMVGVLSFLQMQEIPHQSLKFAHIYLVLTPSNVKLFKIADNILMKYESLLSFTRENHKEAQKMQNIYLSPEELQFLVNEDLEKSARCWHIFRHQEPVPQISIDPFKSDVFTLGMIISHLGLQKSLDQYYKYNVFALEESYFKDILIEIQTKYSQELINIIKIMIEPNQEERPDFIKLDQILDGIDYYKKNQRLTHLFLKDTLSPLLQLSQVEQEKLLRDEYSSFMMNQTKILQIQHYQNQNQIKDSIHISMKDKFQANQIEQTKVLQQSNQNQQFNSFQQSHQNQQFNSFAGQQTKNQHLMMSVNPIQYQQQLQAMNMMFMMQQQNPQMLMMMQNSQNMQFNKQQNQNANIQNNFQTPIRQQQQTLGSDQSQKKSFQLSFLNKNNNNQSDIQDIRIIQKNQPVQVNFDQIRQEIIDPVIDAKIDTIQYEDGSKYTGYIVNDERHGFGKLIFPIEGFYEGQFQHNFMDGQGKFYYNEDLLIYDGEWFQDKFNGFGVHYNKIVKKIQGNIDYKDFSNIIDVWAKYSGDFVMNQREGQGVLEFCTGDKYSGNFSKDKINGYGIFTKSNGQTIIGIWENDKFIKDLVH